MDTINLHEYRARRWKEYPGVPFAQFTDWYEHKQWMIKEKEKFLRKWNNARILAEVEDEENQNKGG